MERDNKYDANSAFMEISPMEKHVVSSFLMNNGFSVFGAQQIAAGNLVSDPQDRQLLASLLAQLAQSPQGHVEYNKATHGSSQDYVEYNKASYSSSQGYRKLKIDF